MRISHAITVCDEHLELKRLLDIIFSLKRDEDEVIVQGDSRRVTSDVISVIHPFLKKGIEYLEFPLNSDFATFKNNLSANCTGDWIFQIDADEYPHENLIRCLPELIDSAEYDEIEMLRVPRVNTVEGITTEWINKWHWNIKEISGINTINYPDFQQRLYKRSPHIFWKNKVHEVIFGHRYQADLPIDFEWSLFHPKTIERQIKQNEFYETILK